ncbi:MAG: GDP-mannose 4,6-dehydratase [Anaerolineae bacterium]|nr:GDP-mannose 4,6-dehydratase [Anaerolineae bacterium]
MKALITGLNGFVGSHLAEYLLAHTDWRVAGTVYGPTRSIDPLREQLELYPGELSRLDAVETLLEQARPDVIFHLAAMAVAGQSWRDPAGTITLNITMQTHILQAVVNLGLRCRVLCVCSSEEYGAVSPGDLPIDEDTPFRPNNPYAVSKVAQDMLGLQYHLSHGVDAVRVRPFNHIGPRQSQGFVVPDFASQIARIEIGAQAPLLRVGNLEARRDFTDVRDVVRAYYLLAERGQSGEAYNVGSGRARAIQEVLDYLVAHSSVAIQVEPDSERMRPSDTPLVVCDYGKLNACTGWMPTILFEQSLSDVLDYWRAEVKNTPRSKS